MREFIDDYGAQDYKLTDCEGMVYNFKSKPLSITEQKKLRKYLLDAKKEIDSNKDADISAGDILTTQMAIIFGGKKEDYERFSDKLLIAVLNDYRDLSVNPTTPQINGESKDLQEK